MKHDLPDLLEPNLSFVPYLLVLAGGMLGGMARFFVSGMIGRWIGQTFPWGTLAVNVTGCLLIGALAAAFRHFGADMQQEWLRDFAFVGVLGGYTTVSSFTLQTVNLALDGEAVQAVFNVLGSAAFCLAATASGFWLVMTMGS